jgi:hypothetical protein
VIRNGSMRDAEQPAFERPLRAIAGQTAPCPFEHIGGYVFGILWIPQPRQRVAIYAANMRVIKLDEPFDTSLRGKHILSL